MKKRLNYESPIAVELAAFGANGQDVGPLGICTNGYYPFANCAIGEHYGSQPCDAGSYPGGSNCETGNTPTGNQCSPVGSVADNTCQTGFRA